VQFDFWAWTGDIHRLLPPYATGLVTTIGSVICGGLIGMEREKAQKPAGTRTLVLICLGSAIFTQASILMAGETSDRTRIAAQIVSGIGFLGAGAIIHDGALVIGVTTGAAIWATAAVGVVIGAGYVAAGFVFSLLILATLAAAKLIDRVIAGPCRFQRIEVSYEPSAGKTRIAIRALLDTHVHEGAVTFDEPEEPAGPGLGRATIEFCHVHRDHRAFLGELVALAGVKSARPVS